MVKLRIGRIALNDEHTNAQDEEQEGNKPVPYSNAVP